jgi:hypothetical protein
MVSISTEAVESGKCNDFEPSLRAHSEVTFSNSMTFFSWSTFFFYIQYYTVVPVSPPNFNYCYCSDGSFML